MNPVLSFKYVITKSAFCINGNFTIYLSLMSLVSRCEFSGLLSILLEDLIDNNAPYVGIVGFNMAGR